MATNTGNRISENAESTAEVSALFALLDDADENVACAVTEKLLEAGGGIAPQLRTLMQSDDNAVVRHNAERALRRMQERSLTLLQQLLGEAVIDGHEPDMERAAVLLSRFGRPETDDFYVHTALNQIAIATHEEFMRSHPPSELGHLIALNSVFFERFGFHGAGDDYYDPDRSYIQPVLQGKAGIPIILSLIYMLAADRSGLEIHGVSMPLHFVVYAPALDIFLDVFNGGMFVSRNDCRAFIEKNGVEFHERMLERTDNIAIILRMIRNLSYSHNRYGDLWEAETLMRFHAELIGR
jgi:regulator of sirC expression with transglutaminase-like and TPR domain